MEGASQAGLHIGSFAVTVVGLSFLFTLLYWRTRSIALCILTHALFNAWPGLIAGGSLPMWQNVLFRLAIPAVVLVAAESWSRMGRQEPHGPISTYP